MHTIIFYSYKGGTGRTLVLANVARYLQTFGQKVFMVDFDLEAPGLHHKLKLGPPRLGVVDYLLSVQETGRAPDDVSPYVLSVEDESNSPAFVMPAGDAPSEDYVRKLGGLDWHELFYGDSAFGVPAFLNLQAQIETQFKPDFLLVDARTGITEIGGVATTLLGDTVVCLALHNEENLAGTRMVLHAIADASPDRSVQLVPVLSRLPASLDRAEEVSLLESVRDYFNQDEIGETLTFGHVDSVIMLHSEPELQIHERILVGEEVAAESLLLRDYFTLFSRVIPQDVLIPHIETLIQKTLKVMLDDPVETERALETLARTTGHRLAWRSLVQFYALRNNGESLVNAAVQLWHVRDMDGKDDLLLWRVVKSIGQWRAAYMGEVPSARRDILDFLVDIWRTVAPEDVEVGTALVEEIANSGIERYEETADIGLTLLQESNSPEAVRLLIREWLRLQRAQDAVELGKKSIGEFPDNAVITEGWAEAAAELGPDAAQSILADDLFSPTVLRAENPRLYARLLAVAGRASEALAVTEELLRTGLRQNRSFLQVADRMAPLFEELGAEREFQDILENELGNDVARDYLNRYRRYPRRRPGQADRR